MGCILIEARERPQGFLSNAVLTPEYSFMDVHLIEDPEPPYIWLWTLCVYVWEWVVDDKSKGKAERVCACMNIRKSNICYTFKSSVCAHMGPNTWLCIGVGKLGQCAKTTFLHPWQIREGTLLSVSCGTHIHHQPSHRALCISQHSPGCIWDGVTCGVFATQCTYVFPKVPKGLYHTSGYIVHVVDH